MKIKKESVLLSIWAVHRWGGGGQITGLMSYHTTLRNLYSVDLLSSIHSTDESTGSVLGGLVLNKYCVMGIFVIQRGWVLFPKTGTATQSFFNRRDNHGHEMGL